MKESRLILGTAQLGMDYGVANTHGKPDEKLASEIVSAALECGIVEFDTARAYGDSETVLGKALREFAVQDKALVISKMSVPEALDDPESMVRSSLKLLGVPMLEAVLLHSVMAADEWLEAEKALNDLKRNGLVRKIGVTAYSPQVAVQALETECFDGVQIPGNIFDRRFERAGVFDLAQTLGKDVYVRSVFLQGLALMDVDSLPDRVKSAEPFVRKAAALAEENGMSRLEAALVYAREAYPGAGILFGAELPQQVRENHSAFTHSAPPDFVESVRTAFSAVDECIIDPSKWS